MASRRGQLDDVDTVETVVDGPAVADRGMELAAGETFETLARGGIEAVGEESEVIDGSVGAAGTEVPGLLDFLSVEIQHHDSKACGEIGTAVGKTDVVDVFVARNLAALDVGDIIGVVVDKDIDIGVIVGHYETFRYGVVVHRGDTHIAESLAFAETHQRIVLKVVIEDPSAGSGIDTVAGMSHMAHP